MIATLFERSLENYRKWRARSAPGSLGDYYRAGGNTLLFEDLPVESSDIVLDVGGYRGDWTAEMCWRYGCRSLVLEPVPEFAAQIQRRFAHNDRIVALSSGLGPTDQTIEMALQADGSSSVRGMETSQRIRVSILGVARLFETYALDEVACLKVNIEGAEYDLLDEMSQRGLLARTRCVLVQFHDVGPVTSSRLAAVRKDLARTHECRFDYELVWERWDRRGSAR